MIDYLSRRDIDPTTGCWNYTGTVAANGYGKILQTTAHRWFYLRLVGPIPVGLQLDHLCRNTKCVNPAHLEPVTHRENMRRRALHYSACLRGHEVNDLNTYAHPNGNRECRPCRAMLKRERRAA